MSFHRENVTWLSPRDGLWYGGFFDFCYVNEDSPGFDPERDVRYDESRFNEVTRHGEATSVAASDELVRDHPNPGGSWAEDDPVQGARYDLMADESRSRTGSR